MKNAKRLLCMLLVLCMVLTVAPVTTWATETKTEAVEATTEAKEEINLSFIKSVNLLKTEGVEVDEDDPTIIAVKAELDEMKVLGAEGDPVPLTEEEKQTILYMYQQYLDNWDANVNLLGVQTPFFLSFNDTKDSLGVLGEMLVMAGVSVDVVRAGYMTYDDVTGMIQNFMYGDALGVQLYGNAIASARDEAIQAVKDSGAKTMAQKLLVLNDWLAHNANFDMTYIMNSGKDEDKKPMIAQNPQQHKYYKTVYDVIYADYEEAIEEQFVTQIEDGLEAEFKRQFYEGAIEQGYYQAVYAEVEAQVEQQIYDQAYTEAYNAYLESMNPTEPEATEPEASEPVETEPVETEPVETEPVETEPVETEPVETEPVETEPVETEPVETEPVETEPVETEPVETEPVETEPVETEPVETEPVNPTATRKPGTLKAEGDEVNPEADAFAKEQAEQAVADNADLIAEQADSVAAEETEKFLTENADAIAADPVAFVEGAFGAEAAAEIATQWEAFWADAQENGVEVDPENAPGYKMTVDEIVAQQMDTAMDDLGGMTPNEAIPVYADQAATGLTGGVLEYWEGSHIGVLGDGYGVCLGYTKAFTYLVQYMNPSVYGTSANADMSKSANWKSREDLYYTNGALDIDKGYIVDSVRITFDASVTMFGETEDNFDSDHFWNAVKVDGQWYYVDPCYIDVYGEVMDRNRVETDGYVNHLYFLFSHSTAAELYDGNYKEIVTLYNNAATDKGYEDAWFSRAKSNVYSDGTNFYYTYSSTDLITMMNDFNMDNADADTMSGDEYKLVAHAIGSTDTKATEGAETAIGDTDYKTLVEFNHPIDPEDSQSETVARVLNASGELVENEMLTELYAEHSEYVQNYPGVNICSALSNGKLYFNLSNCILYYDLSTCEVVLVKEYNTVSGTRDKTNAFGGMAFTVATNGRGDFTFGERPIAGMTIKADGNMYVSVATNLGFISGKEAVDDQTSYGYEYEETNYNPSYTNYGGDYSDMMGDMGYDTDNNDNDEFMWTANFVETLSMSHLNGTSHNYAAVTVAASCTEAGYTENRCSTCGAIEAESRVYSETDLAHDHHYVRFDETYYTKNKEQGGTNTGFCYICTNCYDSVSEPTEPQQNDMYEDYGTSYEEQMENYEIELARYNEIVAAAGHTYAPSDAKWDTDNGTLTFSKLETGCDCADRNTVVDHLLGFKAESITLSSTYNVPAEVVDYAGNCVDGGAIVVYQATADVEGYKFTATYQLQKAEGAHTFEQTWTWTEAEEGGYTATVSAICPICETAHENVEATVVKSDESYAATCTATGADIYTASVEIEGAALTDTNTVVLEKLPHTLEEGVCSVCGAGTVYRYAGAGRCETAIEVANALKETLGVNSFNSIIIANGDNSADALAGSYLAAKKGAPILLYRASAVEMNLEYIQKNLSSNGVVYLLGGNAAVPADVEDGLKAAGITVQRLAGDTRFDTNLAILNEAGVEAGQEILVCTGWEFADSLSASATGLPILLVNSKKNELTETQIEWLQSKKGSTLTIVGGLSAVSAELANELSEYLTTETRLAGDSRYETSVLVAQRYFEAPTSAVLAYARNFPDGLCGGSLAYAMGAPLILTDDLGNSNGQYKETAIAYATGYPIEQGAVLGGAGLISDATVAEIFSMTSEMSITDVQ